VSIRPSVESVMVFAGLLSFHAYLALILRHFGVDASGWSNKSNGSRLDSCMLHTNFSFPSGRMAVGR